MNKDGFTGRFCKDALNQTIGLDKPSGSIRVLDNAAGTGALTFNAVHQLSQIKEVTSFMINACDFSPKMIEKLDIIKKENNVNNIETAVMDGQNLIFSDKTFDYTYSIFGLIFFPDINRGFNEMFRVLKNGGRTAVTSWAVDAPLLCSLYEAYKQTTGTEYTDSRTVLTLSDPEDFKKHLEQAGFVEVQVNRVVHNFELDSIPMILDGFKSNPFFLSVTCKLTSEQLPKFTENLTKLLQSKNTSTTGKVCLPSAAFVGSGKRP